MLPCWTTPFLFLPAWQSCGNSKTTVTPLEKTSSTPADLQVKQLIREALSELADSLLDEEDYSRFVDAFVRLI